MASREATRSREATVSASKLKVTLIMTCRGSGLW
jgi:hypothetical protein